MHTDHLGTPQAMTDSNRTVVWKGDYKPFGEVNEVVGAVGNNFRFPGQYYDAESGLYYNWNRYYLAGVGRYLTADPIGLDGGINLYGYVNQNPVMFADITGLFIDSISASCRQNPALCAELMDTPKPVPIITDTGSDAKDKCKDPCPPCDPPVGTQCYEPDTGHKHWIFLPEATHYHIKRREQRPAPSCECIWKKGHGSKKY